MTFTANHGASGICADGFVLKDTQGIQIPWNSLDVTISDTGHWSNPLPFDSSSDPGEKIRNDVDGSYCSETDSFTDSQGNEVVTFDFVTPVEFTSFELQSYDDMDYNARYWTLEGMNQNGQWVVLLHEEDFDFESAIAVASFHINNEEAVPGNN